MEFYERYSVKGISSQLVWIYDGDRRSAGIGRNNNVLGDKYYCFEGIHPGERCYTIWYPTLEAARKVVKEYIDEGIPIPVKVC